MEKRFYIKISGAAFGVEGNDTEAAIKVIRDHLWVYCTLTALEIGKDVDENGYPLKVPRVIAR